MTDPTNFAKPGARRAQDEIVFQALTVPKFKRRELLAMVPGVNTNMFNTWTARGFFTRGFCQGTVDFFERAVKLMRENEARTVKLYSGGDVLAVMTLELLSRSPLPLALAEPLIGMAQGCAARSLEGAEEHFVAVVGQDAKPRLMRAEAVEIGGEDWFAVVDLDRIVGRFMDVTQPEGTAE